MADATPPTPTKPAKPERTGFQKFFWGWVWPFVLAVVVLTPIRSSVADWYDVPSGSMEPTILPGDRIFVNKLAYGLRVPLTYIWLTRWNEPTPGEIIICHRPDDDTRLVKRLIAKPGDEVQLKENDLYVQGPPHPPLGLRPHVHREGPDRGPQQQGGVLPRPRQLVRPAFRAILS